MGTKRKIKQIYRDLRKHLDSLPIGFPKTISRVELRILKYLFNPNEARLAKFLYYKPSMIKKIYDRIPSNIKDDLSITSHNILKKLLEDLSRKGLIFKTHKNGQTLYSNVPLVIGMFEFNLGNLELSFLKDIEKYIKQGFGIEMINSQVPQLRTIPLESSIEPEHLVVPYDNLREIIYGTEGIITVAECICRKSYDINEDPCSHTDLRETCINIGEMGERYLEIGIGREITKHEALNILKQAEKDGLILQTMNAQEPQVICACCGDCCGTISILKRLPRPEDFSTSNYACRTDTSLCIGCGICVKACHMDALLIKDKKISINLARCIGCGVCVPKCPNQALFLEAKNENPDYIPKDRMDLYHLIENHKKTRGQKIKMLLKVLMGKKNKKPLKT